MKREHFVLFRVRQKWWTDWYVQYADLAPLRCFIFSCHLLFKRPETGRTDGFYLEAFATIMFVCYPWCYLILGLFFGAHTKTKGGWIYYITMLTWGMGPCHACIVGVVSLLFVHTPIAFCFYWLLSVSCIYLSRLRYIATFWTLIRLTSASHSCLYWVYSRDCM